MLAPRPHIALRGRCTAPRHLTKEACLRVVSARAAVLTAITPLPVQPFLPTCYTRCVLRGCSPCRPVPRGVVDQKHEV